MLAGCRRCGYFEDAAGLCATAALQLNASPSAATSQRRPAGSLYRTTSLLVPPRVALGQSGVAHDSTTAGQRNLAAFPVPLRAGTVRAAKA
jgi:hypothetical protein